MGPVGVTEGTVRTVGSVGLSGLLSLLGGLTVTLRLLPPTSPLLSWETRGNLHRIIVGTLGPASATFMTWALSPSGIGLGPAGTWEGLVPTAIGLFLAAAVPLWAHSTTSTPFPWALRKEQWALLGVSQGLPFIVGVVVWYPEGVVGLLKALGVSSFPLVIVGLLGIPWEALQGENGEKVQRGVALLGVILGLLGTLLGLGAWIPGKVLGAVGLWALLPSSLRYWGGLGVLSLGIAWDLWALWVLPLPASLGPVGPFLLGVVWLTASLGVGVGVKPSLPGISGTVGVAVAMVTLSVVEVGMFLQGLYPPSFLLLTALGMLGTVGPTLRSGTLLSHVMVLTAVVKATVVVLPSLGAAVGMTLVGLALLPLVPRSQGSQTPPLSPRQLGGHVIVLGLTVVGTQGLLSAPLLRLLSQSSQVSRAQEWGTPLLLWAFVSLLAFLRTFPQFSQQLRSLPLLLVFLGVGLWFPGTLHPLQWLSVVGSAFATLGSQWTLVGGLLGAFPLPWVIPQFPEYGWGMGLLLGCSLGLFSSPRWDRGPWIGVSGWVGWNVMGLGLLFFTSPLLPLGLLGAFHLLTALHLKLIGSSPMAPTATRPWIALLGNLSAVGAFGMGVVEVVGLRSSPAFVVAMAPVLLLLSADPWLFPHLSRQSRYLPPLVGACGTLLIFVGMSLLAPHVALLRWMGVEGGSAWEWVWVGSVGVVGVPTVQLMRDPSHRWGVRVLLLLPVTVPPLLCSAVPALRSVALLTLSAALLRLFLLHRRTRLSQSLL